MKRLKLINLSILLFLVILSGTSFAQKISEQQKLTIAVLYDDTDNGDNSQKRNSFLDRSIALLKAELTSLLSQKYDVNIPDKYVISSMWSKTELSENYNQLSVNPNVDFIISVGSFSSLQILQIKDYLKPTLLIGLGAPDLFNVPVTPKGTSGIKNLTYLLNSYFYKDDLATFKSIYPFKELGVVLDKKFIEIAPEVFKKFTKKLSTELNIQCKVIPFDGNVNKIKQDISTVEAIYLGESSQYNAVTLQNLIQEINDAKIPSYTSQKELVHNGVLACNLPSANYLLILRRLALTIEEILNNKNTADIPVMLDFKKSLTINMETANKIGYSPNHIILSEAELINDGNLKNKIQLDLKSVMLEAIKNNLSLQLDKIEKQKSKTDLSLAYSNLYPSLKLSTSHTTIDEDRAKMGMGSEHTLEGGIFLSQTIFNQQFLSDISIKKDLLEVSELKIEESVLNTVYQTGMAYFDVLTAETIVNVYKENLRLTKANLETAKLRESTGYSDRSDIYRWESQKATISANLIKAQDFLKNQKRKLNNILNRPVEEDIYLSSPDLRDAVFSNIYRSDFDKYISNPKDIGRFAEFLFNESCYRSPKLKKVDKFLDATDKQRQAVERSRFIPSIDLQFKYGYNFNRSGIGSGSTDPVNIPGIGDIQLSPIPKDQNWSLSLSASLPLFTGFKTQRQSEKLQIEIEQLNKQKDITRHSLELNIQAAVSNILTKSITANYARVAEENAEKNLLLVKAAYSNGSVSVVELIDAQNNSLSAKQQSSKAIYDHFKAILTLERSMGKFLLLSSEKEVDDFYKRAIEFLSIQNN